MEKFKKLYLILTLLFTSCDFKDLSEVESISFDQNFYDSKICIFGDSGINSKNQKVVADFLTNENCSLYLHTGDIIYQNGIKSIDDKNLYLKFLEPYSAIIKSSKVALTLGNHDHRGNIESFIELSKQNGNIIFPNYFYNIKFNDVCLLVVDTNINYNKGQEKWLRKLVNDKKQCQNLIAIGHHPYTSSGKHGNAQNPIKKFLEDYIINNVDLYISGHDHQLSLEYINGKPIQIISGAAAEVRKISKVGISKFQESKVGYAVIEKGILKFKAIDNNLELQTLYEAAVK